MKYPQLYIQGQQNFEFNNLRFFGWFCNAVYCSLVIFYSIYFSFEDNLSSSILSASGRPYSFWSLSIYLSGLTVIISNLKIFLNIDVHHVRTHVIIYGSIFIWFMYIIAYSYTADILQQPEIEGVIYRIFDDAYFWLLMIVLIFIALLPEFIYNRIQREFFPYPYQIIQELELQHKSIREPKKKVVEVPRKHRVSVMNTTGRKELTQSQVHLGFAFSAGKDQTEWLDKRLRTHVKRRRKGVARPGDSDSSDAEVRQKERFRSDSLNEREERGGESEVESRKGKEKE